MSEPFSPYGDSRQIPASENTSGRASDYFSSKIHLVELASSVAAESGHFTLIRAQLKPGQWVHPVAEFPMAKPNKKQPD
jgi:hypothetical protein